MNDQTKNLIFLKIFKFPFCFFRYHICLTMLQPSSLLSLFRFGVINYLKSFIVTLKLYRKLNVNFIFNRLG